jgi:hypothetical protein
MKWVYILQCNNNYYYVGETKRLYSRFWEHNEGAGGLNTSTYEPENIIAIYKVSSLSKFFDYDEIVSNEIYNIYFNRANKIVEDLKNNIYPTNIKQNEVLPKHITIKVERGKKHLIFDKKDNDSTRLNLRMVLPDEYSLEEQVPLFVKKIKVKYDIDI